MSEQKTEARAQELARTLGETKRGIIRKIELLIELMGEEFVEAVFEETLQVEAEGGLMTNAGDRRRTFGGVFFFLAKSKLDAETLERIFPRKYRSKRRAKQSGKAADGTSAQPTQLETLHKAADTLRERIRDMEAKGQKGVAMTQQLLQNTERQIAKLEAQGKG